MIRQYIEQNGGSSIFENYLRCSDLSDARRKHLCRILAKFLYDKFSDKPNKHAKIAVAKASIILFPALKVENSSYGGIVRSTYIHIFLFI